MKRLLRLCVMAALLLYSGAVRGGDIGCRAYTPTNLSASIENTIVMGTMTADEDGIVDSLGFVIAGAPENDFPTRMALYKVSATGSPPPDSLKDSTAAFDVAFGVTQTHSRPVLIGANIYSGNRYGVCVWSATGVSNPTAKGTSTDTVCVGNGVVKQYRLKNLTYSGASWPDTLNATAFTNYFMAYIVYHTTAAGGQPGRLRKIKIGG